LRRRPRDAGGSATRIASDAARRLSHVPSNLLSPTALIGKLGLVSEEAERIVYEESVRSLAQQRELLDGLRNRAGTLLAAASIATAFLSSQALRPAEGMQPQLGSLAWTAIVLFCGVVLLALATLIPWQWTFAHHPHALIGVHIESPDPPKGWQPSTISQIYREISYWNGVHYDQNGRKLKVMFGMFAVACAGLAAEIVIWLILLAR